MTRPYIRRAAPPASDSTVHSPYVPRHQGVADEAFIVAHAGQMMTFQRGRIPLCDDALRWTIEQSDAPVTWD